MAILQRGSRFNDGKLIASQEYVDDHSNKKNNPHSVTKSQVGLGSVQNYGIATKAEAESGSANNKYITPDKINKTTLIMSVNLPTLFSKKGIIIAHNITSNNIAPTPLNFSIL